MEHNLVNLDAQPCREAKLYCLGCRHRRARRGLLTSTPKPKSRKRKAMNNKSPVQLYQRICHILWYRQTAGGSLHNLLRPLLVGTEDFGRTQSVRFAGKHQEELRTARNFRKPSLQTSEPCMTASSLHSTRRTTSQNALKDRPF